jgi:Spy/CpxP family protein refolding chaperone
MKKIVLTMLAIAAFGTMMAQDNKEAGRRGPRMMTPEQMTERMTKELDLNKDQQAKVLDLNKEYKDVIGRPRMHRGPLGPRPDGMKKADGMKKPEDMKKPEGMKKAEDMKKPDGETGATQRPPRAERPELTEAQKEEMKKRMERRKEYDSKLKAILTPEQMEKHQQHQPRGPRR